MIPAIQWRAAMDLAGSHGHGWVYWADGTDARHYRGEEAVRMEPLVPVPVPESWEQADEMYLEHCSRYGITLGLSPAWAHVTGTGRLAWSVDTDGRVDLTVSRPQGIVIRATVRTRLTSEDVLVGDVVSLTTHGPYGERHIDALMRAVRAVTRWEPDDRASWTPDDRTHEALVVARLRAMPGYDDVITEVAS